EAGSPSSHPVRRRNGGNVSLSSHNSSLLLLSPFQSHLCAQELTDAEKVFAECQQDKPIPFYECLSRDQLCCCHKVGEGVYGEVFRTLRGGQHVALKVIPIEGSLKINGEHQKSFAEILPEIIISKELSLLSEGVENRTSGFIQLHSAHCVQGSYPSELLSAWDTFSEEKGTENERPDLFGPEQLFMILEFEFGGEDLEQASCKLPSVATSRSILHQVTAALAVAEEELRFEHRDLHWGNLLIEKSSSCTLAVNLQGEMLEIPSAGIQVKIIDYTLSRLDKDGLTVFCDLSTDEELFLGEGDLQFEVYRKMRQENQNVWSLYKPHSNVLWLHYLCDKLLSQVSYIKKPTSAAQRRDLRRLQDFRREVQQFGSATEVLKRSRLFK
ncbi:serine/threonine-protein kinase haspin, partial [Leptodactylus fuscus]|uniref:serine/threonine-protein kinase haspin n=1 Tax=Leptodactylus fuscus TaxID=238119 RepID=UPI003F4F3A00